MKKLFKFLCIAFLLAGAVSCDNNEQDTVDEKNDPTPVVETISAKWVVDDMDDYESFEFTESGNYIIVKKTDNSSGRTSSTDDTVLFGTYEVNGDEIVLHGFGVITFVFLDDETISFTIELENGAGAAITISAVKDITNDVDNSDKTDLLTGTKWKFVYYATVDASQSWTIDYEHTMTFTRSGTYIQQYDAVEEVCTPHPEEGGSPECEEHPFTFTGVSYWRWANTAQTTIKTWGGTGSDPWTQDLQIVELTAQSLQFIEENNDGSWFLSLEAVE